MYIAKTINISRATYYRYMDWAKQQGDSTEREKKKN